MDMVTTDEGAIEGDYLYTNTFFANGGHERPSYIAKETHLSPDLVPLAPPPGPAPQRSPSLSPPRQISAASEAFNWNKAATLSTSASLSSLPVMPRTLGEPGERFAGKQFSPIAPRSQGIPLVAYSSERRLQLDNEDAWTRRLQLDNESRKRELQQDLNRNGDWEQRWGFAGKLVADDTRSRKQTNPASYKPSLVGYGL